jgi:hypothetical protein
MHLKSNMPNIYTWNMLVGRDEKTNETRFISKTFCPQVLQFARKLHKHVTHILPNLHTEQFNNGPEHRSTHLLMWKTKECHAEKKSFIFYSMYWIGCMHMCMCLCVYIVTVFSMCKNHEWCLNTDCFFILYYSLISCQFE